MISTCCVTNEAVAKSRKAAARAARTHERVYLTGCAANLGDAASPGFPANVVVVAKRARRPPAFVAGDVGAIGCVQADARARPRSRLREDPGRLLVLVQLLRDPARARRLAQPDAPTRCSPRSRRRVEQGHREVVLTGINLGCFRDRDGGVRPRRTSCARRARRRAGPSTAELDRDQPRRRRARRCAARDPDGRAPPACPAPVRRRRRAGAMGRRYTVAHLPARLEPLAGDFNLTTDVIVGFPAEDEAASRRRSTFVERAGMTKVHVFPYSPRPGTRRRPPTRFPPRVKKERAPGCARSRASSAAGAGRGSSAPTTSCSSTGPGGATATTTRRGSSTRPSASSSASARSAVPRRGSLPRR